MVINLWSWLEIACFIIVHSATALPSVLLSQEMTPRYHGIPLSHPTNYHKGDIFQKISHKLKSFAMTVCKRHERQIILAAH